MADLSATWSSHTGPGCGCVDRVGGSQEEDLLSKLASAETFPRVGCLLAEKQEPDSFSHKVPPTIGRVPCEKESQNPPSQLLQALGPPQSQVGGRGKVAQQRMVGNPGGLSKGSGSLCHQLWLWSGSWIRLGLSYLVSEVGAPCKALPMRRWEAQYMRNIAAHRAHPLPINPGYRMNTRSSGQSRRHCPLAGLFVQSNKMFT